MKLLRIFFMGLFIAFIGMLPLGTQNVAAAQIAISDGTQPAILFALGMLVPDVAYVLGTLVAMQWIRKQKGLFRVLEWATLLIVVALAAANFYAAFQPAVQKNVLLSNGLPKFALGLVMNAVNPMQIPFWLGWTTVLFTKKILEPRWRDYLIYAGGVVVGTFAGTAIFIFGGRLVADKISSNQAVLYIVVGIVFAVTAALQVWKMSRKKDVVQRLEHPEAVATTFERTLQKTKTQTD
jgi:threonine/homoserine/homoserine lactone efflux protein